MAIESDGPFFPGYVYRWKQQTTPGTAGALKGNQYDAVELQYIGNGKFTVLSHEGDLSIQ